MASATAGAELHRYTDMARHPKSFLRLPPELRIKIYKHLFSTGDPLWLEERHVIRRSHDHCAASSGPDGSDSDDDSLDRHQKSKDNLDDGDDDDGPITSLLETCRLIRREALPIFSVNVGLAIAQDTILEQHRRYPHPRNVRFSIPLIVDSESTKYFGILRSRLDSSPSLDFRCLPNLQLVTHVFNQVVEITAFPRSFSRSRWDINTNERFGTLFRYLEKTSDRSCAPRKRFMLMLLHAREMTAHLMALRDLRRGLWQRTYGMEMKLLIKLTHPAPCHDRSVKMMFTVQVLSLEAKVEYGVWAFRSDMVYDCGEDYVTNFLDRLG